MKGKVYKRCTCPPETLPRKKDRTLGNCTRKHGQWYFRHDLPPAADGKRRQVKRGGFSTEDDARKALTEALSRLDRGVHVDRSKMSVSTWLDEWLAGKVNLRPSTVVFYKVVCERYLKPELGHLRLTDLRADDVERAFAKIRRGKDGRDQQVSAALVQRCRATLRAALNTAVRRQLIHANPVAFVEVEAHERPRVTVWDAETTGRFLDSTADDWHGPLWHLIASFGLRRGEAAGLRWADVVLEQGVAYITETRTQVGRTVHVGAPKTKSGARTLSLDAGTVAVLKAHRAAQLQARLAWHGAWVDSGLVFTMEDGRGIQPQLITRLFLKACEAGGFPRIRLHDLRHTSASLGLAAGETLVEVSKRLGHSQLSITADTYTHVLPAVARDSSERRAAAIPRAIRAHLVPTPDAADKITDGDVPTSCPPPADAASRVASSLRKAAGQRAKQPAPAPGLEPGTLRLTAPSQGE